LSVTFLSADIKVPSVVENGKAFLVEIPGQKSCRVSYLGKSSYPMFQKDNLTFFLLSTPYKQKLDFSNVHITCKDVNYIHQVEIKEANYKKEQISVSKKIFKQDDKTKKRISNEYIEAMNVYKNFNKESYVVSSFVLPLESKITSYYGNKRLFNNSFKSYHSGVDFRAKLGTPIKASNSGKVVIAKDRYYAGNSVVIDHGLGMYSCYFHLSSIDVKVGDKVNKNDIIGKSGKSGRVSGPHLHFGFIIGGNYVDPLHAIKLLNSTF
jgi:murein DD-endopeptidase MepM/ murein hydrolase activator NlpD